MSDGPSSFFSTQIRETNEFDGNLLAGLDVDAVVDAAKGARADALAELELLVADLVGDGRRGNGANAARRRRRSCCARRRSRVLATHHRIHRRVCATQRPLSLSLSLSLSRLVLSCVEL